MYCHLQFLCNYLDLGMNAGKVQPATGLPTAPGGTKLAPGTPQVPGSAALKPGTPVGTLASNGLGIIHCKCPHSYLMCIW